MKALIDIDDTIALTYYRWTEVTEMYMLIKGYGKIAPVPSYRMEQSYSIPKDKIPYYMDYMNEYFPYDKLEQIPGADRVIQYLISKGIDVYFITSRDKSLAEVTLVWIEERLGITKPKVAFNVNKEKFQRIMTQDHYDILIDNNLDRCLYVEKYWKKTLSILFTGIAVESENKLPDNFYMLVHNSADNYRGILDIINYKIVSNIEKKLRGSTELINIGDYVKINGDAVFKVHPKLPRELKDKYLKVIGLYRDPKTNKLLRVNVRCEGIDNPKSKYNCFYISGKYVDRIKTQTITIPKNNVVTTTPLNYKYFIIKNVGEGVRQIIPVTCNVFDFNVKYVKVHTEDNQTLLVQRKMLFDTEEDAYNYVTEEM